MSWLDDIGAALTGGQAPPQAPAANVGNSLTGLLDDPRARAALLSFGLQAMQPVGIGQTTGGHIAQAIGAGAESYGRAEALDQKAEAAALKNSIAETKLAQADRALDIRERRGTSRKIGGLTDLMRMRFERQDQAAYERRLDRDASDLARRVDKAASDANLYGGTVPADLKPYVGKTPDQIRDILRTSRPRTPASASGTPSTPPPLGAEDDDDEDEGLVTSPAAEQPPVEGARKAQDGNWYVPDPKRPGKYLRVR